MSGFFFNKVAASKPVTKPIETPMQLFSCKFKEIPKKTFFINTWEWLLLKNKIFCWSLFS